MRCLICRCASGSTVKPGKDDLTASGDMTEKNATPIGWGKQMGEDYIQARVPKICIHIINNSGGYLGNDRGVQLQKSVTCIAPKP